MADATKPELRGFGIANYRSFDATGFIVEDIKKINVFIGKNNSGKSNILRAIRALRGIKKPAMPQGKSTDYRGGLGLIPEIDSYERNGAPPTAIVVLVPEELVQSDEALRKRVREAGGLSIQWNTGTGQSDLGQALEGWKDKDLIHLRRDLTGSNYMGTPRREQVLSNLVEPLLQRAVQALRVFDRLIYVESFREIRKAEPAAADDVSFDGHNVIERLRVMQHPKIGKDRDRDTFDRIQQFVRGLLVEPKLYMEVPTEEEAIYVSMHNKRLPLSSYGTGVHQLVILCAALAMYDDYVVCIEEPEIHLHPELQRKFVEFIADNTNNRYFITTHSNVFLDARPDVAIYHVSHDGTKSIVSRADTTPKARDILTDMGYKASDLLQANGVIWVEGPSDRIYLNRWLELLCPELAEGIHYSVAFYGGKNLAHFSAADDPADDLVEVLRINRHAVFVMDRDRDYTGARLNATKERIVKEIGEDSCWVTQGREIENYLRAELLENYLGEKCRNPIKISFDENARLGESIAQAVNGTGTSIPYDSRKVVYAREFSARMTDGDLDVLDLREWAGKIVGHIRRWNHMANGQPIADAPCADASRAVPNRTPPGCSG